MIRELFCRDRPVFVRFDRDRFRVGRNRRERLQGRIVDMLPVRKRFEEKRLVCWSVDTVNGRNGQRCALCRERWSCAERVRLMLLLDGLNEEPVPAILEIGHRSFDSLDRFVAQYTDGPLEQQPVCIGMTRTGGRLRFTFTTAD